MNIVRRVFIFSLALFIAFLFSPFSAPASAQTPKGQKIIILSKNQIVNQDYFVAGSKVTIDGTINGDAYIAGGQIDVNGTINGDLLVAGGQITVRGDVTQNIRVVGGNILVLGTAGKNISLAGGNIMIDKGAKVNGNVTIAGGTARLANNILGNVTAATGMLEVTSDAIINGNLDYWSNNKATIDSGAKILKSTAFHQTNFNHQPTGINMAKVGPALLGIKLSFSLISFISSLIVGILLISLLPVYSQKVNDAIRGKFWLSLLVGLVAAIVIPIVTIILFVTVIGIPFAIFLIFVYGIVIYISKLFVAYAAGAMISKKANWNINSIWSFVIGLVLYYVVGFIPVIGGLMKLAVLLTGIGALIIQKKHHFAMLREKKLI
jgi:hypothetical protein